jgi:hypothetical protein
MYTGGIAGDYAKNGWGELDFLEVGELGGFEEEFLAAKTPLGMTGLFCGGLELQAGRSVDRHTCEEDGPPRKAGLTEEKE